MLALAEFATSQEAQTGDEGASQRPATYQTMTPEQRAAATREFLGLGPEPDRAAAGRGAPLFQRNCSFCHGRQARGATGPGLITSEQVLGDDHGEHLIPFLKKGRPEKGMPAFATMQDAQLRDIAEFMHLQVEDVANRGSYHVLNIVVGDRARGKTYVASHCMSCHTAKSFTHIAGKFRSPEQLQRGWIWPSPHGNSNDGPLAVTAIVKTPDAAAIAGRVTQLSDFRITLVDNAGKSHVIDREPGVEVSIKDPLAAHEELVMTMTNKDMHNVTAYFETLK
jgi:mono/diheme cytochrome c family protein